MELPLMHFLFWLLCLYKTWSLDYNKNSLENDDGTTTIFAASKIRRTVAEKLDIILNEIQRTQGEIRKIGSKMKPSSRISNCKSGDARISYMVENCGNHTGPFKHHYVVDGDYNYQDDIAGVCRVIVPKTVGGKNYRLSVKLYSTIGPMGVNSGFLGFAFNVADEFNFDFVLINLHQPDKCYIPGFLQNGKKFTMKNQVGECPGGPPRGRQWFRLTLQVLDREAALSLNGVQVANLVPHFDMIGRGGVVVANGAHSLIKFKQFNITSTPRSNFKFLSCKSYNRVSKSYNLMVASEGKWPAAGFCRAISRDVITGDNYAISVSLYNQGASTARDGGMVGVMYNVHNYYNYDFIYFRPSIRGGCYTTGFVQNSQIQWIKSNVGPCPGGPKGSGEWFNVTVEMRGSQASIQVSGKHVVTINPHFSPMGRGGVLLANGKENVGAFRKFAVKAIPPYPFSFYDCARSTKEIQEYFILDAKHGKWPQNTFCKALARTQVPGKHYFMAAEIFMQGTLTGRETDYAGVMFNVEDQNNYDFLYLTPHTYKNCFKAGFVLNGEIQWSSIKEGKCPGSRPTNGEWIQLEVTVSNVDTMVYLRGHHLLTYRPHYPPLGRAGVIVGNGFRNVLSFREFVLYPRSPLSFTFHTCGEGTHITNTSVVLDASLPRHRPILFCRAMYRKPTNLSQHTDKYSVEADLFNVDSWQGGDWGNLGLIYNAKDESNFDFVFMNFESQDECYQYGAMFNGVPRYSRDYLGRCKLRPPTSKWFVLKLDVNKKNNIVQMKLNDKPIGTIKSSSPYMAKGGVLVPNGFKNVVMFRNFQIQN